jgi:hypothetical protein
LIAHQQQELSRTANGLTTTARHKHLLFQTTCLLAAHSLLKSGAQVVAVCAVTISHLIQVVAQVVT